MSGNSIFIQNVGVLPNSTLVLLDGRLAPETKARRKRKLKRLDVAVSKNIYL